MQSIVKFINFSASKRGKLLFVQKDGKKSFLFPLFGTEIRRPAVISNLYFSPIFQWREINPPPPRSRLQLFGCKMPLLFSTLVGQFLMHQNRVDTAHTFLSDLSQCSREKRIDWVCGVLRMEKCVCVKYNSTDARNYFIIIIFLLSSSSSPSLFNPKQIALSIKKIQFSHIKIYFHFFGNFQFSKSKNLLSRRKA